MLIPVTRTRRRIRQQLLIMRLHRHYYEETAKERSQITKAIQKPIATTKSLFATQTSFAVPSDVKSDTYSKSIEYNKSDSDEWKVKNIYRKASVKDLMVNERVRQSFN